jgi:hypothetical protein
VEEPYGPRPDAARAIRKRADGDGDLARVVGAIGRGDFTRRMSASSTRGSARRSAKENRVSAPVASALTNPAGGKVHAARFGFGNFSPVQLDPFGREPARLRMETRPTTRSQVVR